MNIIHDALEDPEVFKEAKFRITTEDRVAQRLVGANVPPRIVRAASAWILELLEDGALWPVDWEELLEMHREEEERCRPHVEAMVEELTRILGR
jgi:hypothetical protein